MANKQEIAQHIANEFEFTQKKSEEIVTEVFKFIASKLQTGEKVSVAGFGGFEVNERAAREGRNPSTGKTIKIEASRNAKFKPSSSLKQQLN